MSERPGEAEFLASYDPTAYPAFALTVDLTIFTIRSGVLSALLIGGTGAVLLDWLVLDKLRRLTVASEELRRQAVAGQGMELALNSRAEQIRRLRHDIRGALSPALLIADRLLSHADPSVQRAGQIMVRTVDRATGLLADPDAKADE